MNLHSQLLALELQSRFGSFVTLTSAVQADLLTNAGLPS